MPPRHDDGEGWPRPLLDRPLPPAPPPLAGTGAHRPPEERAMPPPAHGGKRRSWARPRETPPIDVHPADYRPKSRPRALSTPWGGGPSGLAAMRPGHVRRGHPHGNHPCSRLEEDVRRLPQAAGGEDGHAVTDRSSATRNYRRVRRRPPALTTAGAPGAGPTRVPSQARGIRHRCRTAPPRSLTTPRQSASWATGGRTPISRRRSSSRSGGVRLLRSSLIETLRTLGLMTAIVSISQQELQAVSSKRRPDHLSTSVDRVVSADLGLPGPSRPTSFWGGRVARLCVTPRRAGDWWGCDSPGRVRAHGRFRLGDREARATTRRPQTTRRHSSRRTWPEIRRRSARSSPSRTINPCCPPPLLEPEACANRLSGQTPRVPRNNDGTAVAIVAQRSEDAVNRQTHCDQLHGGGGRCSLFPVISGRDTRRSPRQSRDPRIGYAASTGYTSWRRRTPLTRDRRADHGSFRRWTGRSAARSMHRQIRGRQVERKELCPARSTTRNVSGIQSRTDRRPRCRNEAGLRSAAAPLRPARTVIDIPARHRLAQGQAVESSDSTRWLERSARPGLVGDDTTGSKATRFRDIKRGAASDRGRLTSPRGTAPTLCPRDAGRVRHLLGPAAEIAGGGHDAPDGWVLT